MSKPERHNAQCCYILFSMMVNSLLSPAQRPPALLKGPAGDIALCVVWRHRFHSADVTRAATALQGLQIVDLMHS